uniref:MFS domain-containing protein n=1 Tax=Rhabditophanes sp. KR3021 TaxID=114890 RepID=A0AC35TGK4_9BILA
MTESNNPVSGTSGSPIPDTPISSPIEDNSIIGKMFPGKKRYAILCIAVLGLAALLANVLVFGFGLICMTEERFHWHEYNISLGLDVFEKIDFDVRNIDIDLSLPTTTTTQASFIKFPDFDINFKTPSIGFNSATFDIATKHPEIFGKILKTIVVEGSKLALDQAGKALDPRKFDFNKLRNGLNFSSFDISIVDQFKRQVLEKLDLIKDLPDGTNLTEVRPPRIDDIEVNDITWKGDIKGRVKIIDKAADFSYTQTERAVLLSIAGIGALLGFLPMNLFINRIGVRKTVTIAGVVSAFVTATVPLSAYFGFYILMINLALIGFAFSCTFPAIAAITEKWSVKTEKSLYYSLLTLSVPLGAVMSYPFGGVYCRSFLGWEYLFIVAGFVTIFTTFIFCLKYRNNPGESVWITIHEQRLIDNGKVIDGRKRHSNVPIPRKQIFTSPSVLSLWIASFAIFVSFSFVFLTGPQILHNQRKLCIYSTGFVLTITALICFILKAIFANRFPTLFMTVNWTEHKRATIFVAVSLICACVFLNIIMLSHILDETMAVVHTIVFVFLALVSLTLASTGIFRSLPVISQQHSQFVSLGIQATAGLALFIVPTIYELTLNTCIIIGFAGILSVIGAIFYYLKSNPATPCDFTGVEQTTLPSPSKEQSKPIIKSDLERSEN